MGLSVLKGTKVFRSLSGPKRVSRGLKDRHYLEGVNGSERSKGCKGQKGLRGNKGS